MENSQIVERRPDSQTIPSPSPQAPDYPSIQPTQAAGMARAASLIAAGNVISRILGLVRDMVIANLFGATGLVSAYHAARIIPTMLYDLLINGMIGSALVPVFSEQAERDRAGLWHLASLVLSLAVIILGLAVLMMELLAPQVASLLVPGFDDELIAVTASLMRMTIPAALFLSLSGIITGLLYALKRFVLPAFTAAIFNAAIVVVALVGALVFKGGIETLAIGLLLGAFFQVLLQLPGLRDARLRFVINLQHPALRRIGKLYLPVILGLVISEIAIVLDRNFASHTGEQSIAWMEYATRIIQFPMGLVSVAISMAILPTLSRLAAATSEADSSLDEFMNTLATGLRLVLILIIPATVALFILARPVIALLFEHGDKFTSLDTQQTVLALRLYLIGLIFAAIDQPLIFAFYARQNTLTPALVGLLGVGFYLVAALLPTLVRPMQMTDLVLANSVQLTGHALVMLWLTHRVASLRRRGLGPTTLKAVAASLAMGVGLWAALPLLRNWLPEGLISEITLVSVVSLFGGGIYLLALILLGVQELTLLSSLLQRFLPKR